MVLNCHPVHFLYIVEIVLKIEALLEFVYLEVYRHSMLSTFSFDCYVFLGRKLVLLLNTL